MKKHVSTTDSAPHDIDGLLEDARALLSATTDVAGEKVAEARQRLTDAIERGRETWDSVRERAVAGAKATDQKIRTHPYQSIGIAFGVGALLGYYLSRRKS